MQPDLRQIWGKYRAYHQFSRDLDHLNVSPAITNRFWLLSLVALVNNGP